MLDPLSEPQPSEETGPGTHFRPESATSRPITPPNSARKLSKNPFRRSPPSKSPYTSTIESSGKSKRHSYPSPPPSTSPRHERPRSGHSDIGSSEQGFSKHGTSSHRNSLGARISVDNSCSPLEQIKKDAKSANRSPHLRRSHQILPDTIDSLSTVGGGPYHHGGPYDATLSARNTSSKSSPLQALVHSTSETLKATPKEKIIDSVRGHRPLDGVAVYAPGEADRNGHVYDYEQGDNMMISGGNPEGGAYKRWPGVNYHPDDVKGKGEPSYSIEKALQGQGGDLKGHRKSSGGGEYEMTSVTKHAGDGSSNAAARNQMWDDGEESGLRRKTGSLKKRWGSVRKQLRREA